MDITSFILTLLQVQGEQTIVFTSSVVSTQRLCTLLNCFEGLGLRMIEYSSLQHQYSRSKALDAFRAGDVEVLVASDAIPVDVSKLDQDICKIVDNCFTRARLHLNFSILKTIQLAFLYGRASLLIPVKENGFCGQHTWVYF